MVYFFKFIDGEDKDTGEPKKIPLLKYYSVFHISQCDGMKPRLTASEPFDSGLQPDERAESNYLGLYRSLRCGIEERAEQ